MFDDVGRILLDIFRDGIPSQVELDRGRAFEADGVGRRIGGGRTRSTRGLARGPLNPGRFAIGPPEKVWRHANLSVVASIVLERDYDVFRVCLLTMPSLPPCLA